MNKNRIKKYGILSLALLMSVSFTTTQAVIWPFGKSKTNNIQQKLAELKQNQTDLKQKVITSTTLQNTTYNDLEAAVRKASPSATLDTKDDVLKNAQNIAKNGYFIDPKSQKSLWTGDNLNIKNALKDYQAAKAASDANTKALAKINKTIDKQTSKTAIK